MSTIVRDQESLDAAIAAGKTDIVIDSPAGVWLRVAGSSSVVAWGSSSVEARESSRVVARESSRVVARESSRVVAWGSSSVVAWGSSSVVAWGSSSVEARESSSVEARESSRVVAWGSSSVVALGSSRVEARGSSSVEAWGSSSVEARESSRVEAWGSSRVMARESSRVVAWGSSSVEAWGSSSVEARESSRVVARESSRVMAGAYTTVHLHSQRVTLDAKGAVVDMTRLDLDDLSTWLDYKGVTVTDGKARLYKYVDADLSSYHGTAYPIGETVTAPDWTLTPTCGGGLHVSESPSVAERYAAGRHVGARYLAVEVDVTEAVVVEQDKIKCRSLRVLHEVDAHGDEVQA